MSRNLFKVSKITLEQCSNESCSNVILLTLNRFLLAGIGHESNDFDFCCLGSYSNPIGMQCRTLNQSSTSLFMPSNLAMSTWSIASADNLTRSSSVLSLGASIQSPSGSYQRRFIRSQRTSLDSAKMWRNKSEQSEEVKTFLIHTKKIFG